VSKAKWSIVLGVVFAVVQMGVMQIQAFQENNDVQYWERDVESTDPMQPWEKKTEAKVDGKYIYDNDGTEQKYDLMEIHNYPRGRVVMFSNKKQICTSKFLVPGTEILPMALLQIAYIVTLCWLFLGISIVADIFMSAIEKITS